VESDGRKGARQKVIADGVAYLGDMDGKVFAWNLADGKELWNYKVESGFIASPAIRGGLLYIGDIDGKFYALDIKTGQPKWTFSAEAEIDSGANFWKDNVLFGSQDANLYCLNAESGTLVWKFAIQDQIRCMPTVVGDRSFVAGCDSILHIVDLTKGEEAAGVPIEAPTGVTPAVLGDNVYFGTEGGAMFAVNWKDAKVTWKTEDKASSRPYHGSPPCRQGSSSSAAATASWRLRSGGGRLWTFATKQRIDSSPVIVGSRVGVGAADAGYMQNRPRDGKQLWNTRPPVASPARPQWPTEAGDRERRGVVYCFGASKEIAMSIASPDLGTTTNSRTV
jgi:outer membrane protein assembly factor BamB